MAFFVALAAALVIGCVRPTRAVWRALFGIAALLWIGLALTDALRPGAMLVFDAVLAVFGIAWGFVAWRLRRIKPVAAALRRAA